MKNIHIVSRIKYFRLVLSDIIVEKFLSISANIWLNMFIFISDIVYFVYNHMIRHYCYVFFMCFEKM
jgi:hypothetical protein